MAHLFFDLDGTLTEPAQGIIACMQHTIRELAGPTWSDDALRRFIGPPLRDAFREIFATDDAAAVELAVHHYRERFGTIGLFENQVYPGIAEALAELEASGHTLWVVTAKAKIYADRIIEHFGLLPRFRGIYGAELSGERSTKPELIGALLQQEHVDPRGACMIGDRMHDIHGAKAHPGVLALGVLWGYGTREELQTAGADALVERIDLLPSALHALLAQTRT